MSTPHRYLVGVVALGLGCKADPDPARGRWTGQVSAYESSYYSELEADFVGSSVTLELTNTADGRRMALLDISQDRIGYLGALMTSEAGVDQLAGSGAELLLSVDGERLTASATAGGDVYSLRFEATREGDLDAQDPDSDEGQWFVEASYADSNCAEVEPSATDAIESVGIGVLDGDASGATWADPIEHVDLDGTLAGRVFQGTYRWDAVAENGDVSTEQARVELDLEAGTGIGWARQTGVPCYGWNLTLARLLDRLALP